MKIEIVKAHGADHDLVAALHTASWQASYGGILPDDYLRRGVAEERRAYWARALPAGDYADVLLAAVKGEPVGFIALKDGADAGYDATIEHLHVLPAAQRQGIGCRLLGAAADRLIARKGVSVCLWVFEANRAAIGFYERLGGLTDAHGTDKFAGSDAADRRIGWHDLAALARACRSEDVS